MAGRHAGCVAGLDPGCVRGVGCATKAGALAEHLRAEADARAHTPEICLDSESPMDLYVACDGDMLSLTGAVPGDRQLREVLSGPEAGWSVDAVEHEILLFAGRLGRPIVGDMERRAARALASFVAPSLSACSTEPEREACGPEREACGRSEHG